MVNILTTGGSGFIGSHTCLVLLNAGFDVVVVDSFLNSSEKILKKLLNYQILKITKKLKN